jgi:hypothetical protein
MPDISAQPADEFPQLCDARAQKPGDWRGTTMRTVALQPPRAASTSRSR